MAKLAFPKQTRPLDAGLYADEMAGQTFHVWVNPPSDLARAYFRIAEDIAALKENAPADGQANAINDVRARLVTWLAEILSQHSDEESHWSTAELADLEQACTDTDPLFWGWLTKNVVDLVMEHRGLKKKA